jgi:transcription initiation factor TFIID subunit 12
MDNSQQGRAAQAGAQQQASLIRPEQVSRLPQLNPQQKLQYEQAVRKFWEIMNSTPQGEQRHNQAYQKLVETSQTLMQGMKNFQAAQKRRQLQQQQAAQQAAASGQPVQAQPGQGQPQPGQAGQSGSALQFNQLHTDIQEKVNSMKFSYPPAMIEGTKQAEDWLREAKARYGQALQRMQVATAKADELKRQYNGRQQQGNPLNQQESEAFRNKLSQCQKAITESQNFMEKFRQQQADFVQKQPQNQFQNQQAQSGQATESQAPASAGGVQGGAPGPQAHSISSAVALARQQTQGSAQGGSPATATAPSQPNPAASATPIKAEGQEQSVFAAQAQPNALNQSMPAPQSAGGRPTSQHAPQSALQQHASQQNVHAHPLSANLNAAKVSPAAITKNLQVSDPRPVQMPPSRPTLSGGAAVGLPGQLAQPAIPTLPGYVLESSEDGRLLSKKKLNELVREVCGPGGDGSDGDGLTPDAEEVCIPLAPLPLHSY